MTGANPITCHRRRLASLVWQLVKMGWQFSGSQVLDEIHVRFFGAFGAAWDGASDAGRRRGGRLRRGGGERRGHAGVQSIGSGVVDAAPGDHFELIAHQTSGATKNLAADELTCLL